MNNTSQPNYLQVRMLGGLSISLQGKEVLSSTGRWGKIWDMLEFLLINRNRGYSADDLIELLCQDEDNGSPMSIIKNLAYRLRKVLEDAGLPAKDLIVYRQGIYCWNSAIPCLIDAEAFEEKWKQAENASITKEARLVLYQEAIDLYGGRFLPMSSSKEWVIPLAAYYHRLYVECINGAHRILSQGGDLEPMVSICNHAIVIDPYDENLYSMLIEALVKLGRYNEALAAYDRVTSFLFNELGITPSQKIRGLYNEITKSVQPVEKDIVEIKSDLTEPRSRDSGAYLCDYEIFKTVYRFTARALERSVQSVFLVVFTLTSREGNFTAKQLKTAMGHLQKVVGGSLRRGDAYSRYSTTQFIVMLSGVNEESCRLVCGRIMDNYNKTSSHRYANTSYKLHPVNSELSQNLD